MVCEGLGLFMFGNMKMQVSTVFPPVGSSASLNRPVGLRVGRFCRRPDFSVPGLDGFPAFQLFAKTE
jgi:hypothetical protein